MHDLSHPVLTGIQTYPGDPAVSIDPALTIDRDGVAVGRLGLGSHTGTHVDAPGHVVEGGRTLHEVGLDELYGEAIVRRLPDLPDRSRYGLAELQASAPLPDRLPPIVIIDTGWARHFGTDRALRHPALDEEAATELIRRGMHVLAVDTHSPDLTGDGSDLTVHRAVLGADRLIVENLTNLDGLPGRVRAGFFPLRLADDGAPVRAVAFDEGDPPHS